MGWIHIWECMSLFGISRKSRDDLVGVLRWVGMSQWSCKDVGMRSEYTWKCTKLWRCQGMHKRHVRVWGHMIVKVMCQIGMRECGELACMGMAGWRMRAWVTMWKGKVVTLSQRVVPSQFYWDQNFRWKQWGDLRVHAIQAYVSVDRRAAREERRLHVLGAGESTEFFIAMGNVWT